MWLAARMMKMCTDILSNHLTLKMLQKRRWKAAGQLFLWPSPPEAPWFEPWASPWLTFQGWIEADISCWRSLRTFKQKLKHIWPWSGIPTPSPYPGKNIFFICQGCYFVSFVNLHSIHFDVLLFSCAKLALSLQETLKRICVLSEDCAILCWLT